MTVTNIDELEKCKEFCIKNGYCNFSVHAGQAYIRNNTIEECREKRCENNSSILYLLSE